MKLENLPELLFVSVVGMDSVLDGFSGHGDRNDLAWWYEQTGGRIEHGFLVHGEPESMDALAPVLQQHVSSPVQIPDMLATYEV